MAEVEPSSGPPENTIRPEEDFLFHLYRGSELLDDHRLLEAQSELEYALTLQPADARTLGLLAVVYFRRGFHVRAIATYRALLHDRPGDPTLRMNLALCHLKTGESQAARATLEALVAEDVTDQRAWGYLALALDRLGYVEQAREAFERAGQPDLAWRMVERGASAPRASMRGESHIPATQTGPRPRASGTTFEPIDSGELRLDLVRGEPSHAERVAPPPAPLQLTPRPRHDTLTWGTQPRGADAARARTWTPPAPLANFVEDARLERLGDAHNATGVTVMGSHLARIEVDAELSPQGFAFRVDALRSYHGALDPELLPRQTRATATHPADGPGETFGGIGTPFASMKPPGQLLVGPRAAQRIHAFTLHDEVVFFREAVVLGFDLSLHYENGRLGLGAADAVPIVQLRGQGTLLLEISADLLALEVKAGGLTVRKEVVVGWIGRLLPRPLSAGEAPGGQHGLLGFSGEGTVLVSAK